MAMPIFVDRTQIAKNHLLKWPKLATVSSDRQHCIRLTIDEWAVFGCRRLAGPAHALDAYPTANHMCKVQFAWTSGTFKRSPRTFISNRNNWILKIKLTIIHWRRTEPVNISYSSVQLLLPNVNAANSLSVEHEKRQRSYAVEQLQRQQWRWSAERCNNSLAMS